VIATGALLALAGCGAKVMPDRDRPVPVNTATSADADAARQYLGALAELLESTPARQAEILDAARANAENAPTTMHRLRYALILATPGHGGADPVAARRQLSELLARPELLLPAERSLAALALRDVDDRLVLIAENRRLLQEAAARDKDRTATVNRRLQAEIEENARLRRALDEAQKKLDAVTQLERSIVERGGSQGKP
jgi:N-acetylmuramoyl-L-alanine amidase